MIKYFTILGLFFSISFVVNSNAQILFPKEKIEQINDIELINWVKKNESILQNKNMQLKVDFRKNTQYTYHYTMGLYYGPFRFFNTTLKISTDKNGNILTYTRDNVPNKIPQEKELEIQFQKLRFLNFDEIMLGEDIKHIRYEIVTKENVNYLCAIVSVYSKTKDYTLIINDEGIMIDSINHLRYFTNIDTTIQAKVFIPDPLTKLGQSYGGTYIDNNDANLAWFATAYDTVTVPVIYDTASQIFRLENKYIMIDDFEMPAAAPVTQATPDFYYNRNESGFEDVNVMYHITEFKNYINSLGYDSLMNLQVTADAHGMLGADNSMFNRNGGSPTLNFGTGGVDDAEDADVIIHEYCHGVSWSANDNNNFSQERSGLDEGLSDYFATSYSRSINPFSWEKMFTWDGHNEYWSGRVANTAAIYPTVGNIYAIGEIWNAAMSNIWTDLGNFVTDKLMLEALHFFTNSTTLPQAAKYVMLADTVLFNGIHANTLCTHFQQKNLLDNQCEPVNVKSEHKTTKEVLVINTHDFALGNAPLEILFLEDFDGTIEIKNINGSTVYKKQLNNTQIETINPQFFTSGIYFLVIKNKNMQKVHKLSRF